MKMMLLAIAALGCTTVANAQSKTATTAAKDTLIVEAACGQCRFGLAGKSCDLAVRIDGKAYFVDGTHIDKHGDAHASDGFCNAVRKAKITGTLVDDRFKASFFQLVPDVPKPKSKKRQSK